jgi:K+-transporting ATPase ATPase A chain
MDLSGWLQVALLFLGVLACVKPVGIYMARIFAGERVFLSPLVAPVEGALYRVCRIDPNRSMSWKTYVLAVMGFSLVGFAYLYTLLRTQAYLPLNPQGFGNVAPDLAFTTAISFLTNTNWQFYSGESSLSYLTQMVGLSSRRRPASRSRSRSFAASCAPTVRRSATSGSI